MAVRRLQKTEKRLHRYPELSVAYSEVMQAYQDKGYIRKVPPEEEKPLQVWYLPHFPILRPDKSTTETRIVFEVLEYVPSADCVDQVDLDKGDLSAVKTLGVLWSPKEDYFKFQVHQPCIEQYQTMRGFLSQVATMFDPLGLLSPYVTWAKTVLQDMWASGVNWDEMVDGILLRKANQWFVELQELTWLRIPRCLREETKVREITLHTFVDPSQEAYGAATYARVAPLQAVSIPRLELMAVVVGRRLAETMGAF